MIEEGHAPNLFYYTGVSLRNFRGFKKSGLIPLAPLTLLVGPNSSGKSSIFDALLFLSQSQFGLGPQKPQWAGPLVDLGSYTDAVHKHRTSLPIEIEVELMAPSNYPDTLQKARKDKVAISYGFRTTKKDPIGMLSTMKVSDRLTDTKLLIRYTSKSVEIEALGKSARYLLKQPPRFRIKRAGFFHIPISKWISDTIGHLLKEQRAKAKGKGRAWQRIQQTLEFPQRRTFMEVERVASGRAAPKRWYSVAELAGVRDFPFIGPRVYDEVDPRMLTDVRDVRAMPESYFYSRGIRRRRPQYSLSSILRKLGIASEIESSTLSPYHSAINLTDNVTRIRSNLIDVGYGASQAIPVIRACLSRASGPLFVEQPEIHLHPSAQGVLAELLCETSMDRQVVIETHSEHMVNRARILVAQKRLHPKHVQILLVNRNRKGSFIYPIPILENGEFGAEWPKEFGFFDERYNDTMLLMKLKGQGGSAKYGSRIGYGIP